MTFLRESRSIDGQSAITNISCKENCDCLTQARILELKASPLRPNYLIFLKLARQTFVGKERKGATFLHGTQSTHPISESVIVIQQLPYILPKAALLGRLLKKVLPFDVSSDLAIERRQNFPSL